MAALRSIQQQLQDSVTEYRQMQQEVSSVVNQQMKLQQQVNETSMVQQELEMLGDGNGEGVVYKLVGPLLVRQDTYEAKANVGKRLEFIKKEMYAVPTNPLASRVVRSPMLRASTDPDGRYSPVPPSRPSSQRTESSLKSLESKQTEKQQDIQRAQQKLQTMQAQGASTA